MNKLSLSNMPMLLAIIIILSLNSKANTGYDDYIIIYHSSLDCMALGNLITLQENRGFSVGSFEITDGVTRDSIKSIIVDKFFNSAILPSYVLLIGSCRQSIDSNHIGEDIADSLSGNLIPAFYHEDGFSHWTAYDYEYADMYGKSSKQCLPDIHIGRIPTLDTVDLSNYVNKLTYYFTDNQAASWKNDVYLIADDQYVGTVEEGRVQPQTIINDMDQIESILSGHVDILRHNFTDYSTVGERTDAFCGAIDNGKPLVIAMGTGAHTSKLTAFVEKGYYSNQFDAYQDLSASYRYPVIVGASCSIGQSDVPAGERGDDNIVRGWPEHLLFPANKGAIALIGPSGSSNQWANSALVTRFVNRLLRYPQRTLGQIFDGARYEEISCVDAGTYKMYSIYGDPSLVMNINVSSLDGTVAEFDFSLPGWPVLQNYRIGNDTQIVNDTSRLKSTYNLRKLKRIFNVAGFDQYDISERPLSRWRMFSGLCIPINSLTRFFKYSYYVLKHPAGIGLISINAELASGLLLSDTINGQTVVDMFGNGVAAIERTTQLNELSINVFDLTPFYGDTVISLMVEYNGLEAWFEGEFKVNVLELGFYPEWGSPPIVGSIVTPPYPNVPPCEIPVYITAADYDSDLGDSLSYYWSSDHGTFSGSGASVTYNPCPLGQETLSPVITVTVSDRGNHSFYKREIIHITDTSYPGDDPPIPPPSCPYVYVWSDGEFKKDNVILSGARNALENNRCLTDYYPLTIVPGADNSKIRLRIAEEEFESSFIYSACILVYNAELETGEKLAISQDGHIVAISQPILPFYAYDNYGFDMLDKVLYKDSLLYECYERGYLDFGFDIQDYIIVHSTGKIFIDEGGGGVPVDPPGCGSGECDKMTLEYPYEISEFGNIAKMEMLVGEDLFETIAEFSPRKYGAMQYQCDLTPYISDNRWVGLRLSWEEQYRTDQLAFYFSRKCPLDTVISIMNAYNHLGVNIDYLSLTNNPYALKLETDQYIDLEFSVPNNLNLAEKILVLKAKGYYKLLDAESPPDSTDSTFVLDQNYPNPFNSATTFSFTIPIRTHVNLTIYNILGQRIIGLVNDALPAGRHQITWEGLDSKGNPVASGIYFAKFIAGDYSVSRKMTIVK